VPEDQGDPQAPGDQDDPDRTPPGMPVLTIPAEGQVVRNSDFLVAGTAEPGATVVVYDERADDPVGTVVAGADGFWSVELTGVADGVHSYIARALDAAGNRSAWTPWHVVRVHTGPGALATGGPERVVRAAAAAASVTLALRCEAGSPVDCRGAVTAGALGSTSFAAVPGAIARVALAVPARLRRQLLEGGRLRLEPVADLEPRGSAALPPVVVRAPKRPAALAVGTAAAAVRVAAGLRVRVAGAIARPRRVPAGACAGGRVLVEVLGGTAVLATRTVRAALNCRFRAVLAVRPAGAVPVRARATFLGNAAMSRRAGRPVPVALG
jgi:hypothetical protein